MTPSEPVDLAEARGRFLHMSMLSSESPEDYFLGLHQRNASAAEAIASLADEAGSSWAEAAGIGLKVTRKLEAYEKDARQTKP